MTFIKNIREKINPALLPMKCHYFLWNAGTAPAVSFASTWARQRGLSSVAVGTVFAALPVCGLLAKPLLGALADRYQLQRALFLAFQALTAAAFFSVQFVPAVPTRTTVALLCGNTTSFRLCPGTAGQLPGTHVSCELSCRNASSLVFEICSSWTESDQCQGPTGSTTETSAVRPTGGTTLEALCDSAAADVQLVAEVPPGNILQQGSSCLELRVGACRVGDACLAPRCGNPTGASCEARCDDAALREALESAASGDDPVSLYQFWLLLGLLALSWVGMAVVVSLGDALCFQLLGERPILYGRQRLWGSIGWGIFSLMTGALIDEFSRGKQKKDYTVMFYILLILVGLNFCICFQLKPGERKRSKNILRDIAKLLPDLRIVMFVAWCIACGLCTGLLWQFLFWHLEDLAVLRGGGVARWTKTLQGAVSAVQTFGGELPFLFLSGGVLARLGHVHTMSLVLAAYGARLLLYSLLADPWWSLPIELLHGPTYGLMYATMASYASIAAPPGTEATAQGLVGAVFEGVGASLGSLLGGILYQRGGAFTFRVYGVGALVALCVHVCVHCVLARRPHYGVQPSDIAGKSTPVQE
ncbi:major facilitator superfamily domain-containing protein 6-like isoform X2 [Bacillus rossius redtenbacheri]